MSDQYQAFPSNISPVVEPSSGLVTTAWNYFFAWLYRKTGGSGATIPVEDITVGTSPFTYDAMKNGTVVVSGPDVTTIQLLRGDRTVTLGVTGGAVPVLAGDRVKVFHNGSPAMSFLPSEVILFEVG